MGPVSLTSAAVNYSSLAGKFDQLVVKRLVDTHQVGCARRRGLAVATLAGQQDLIESFDFAARFDSRDKRVDPLEEGISAAKGGRVYRNEQIT